MTQAEYNKFEEELKHRGYRKFDRTINNEDWNYFKCFGKSKEEEGRSNYQICFSVFDFSPYAYKEKSLEKNPMSFMCYVLVSRTTNERVDLMLASGSSITIEEAENRAESFFRWVEDNIPLNEK